MKHIICMMAMAWFCFFAQAQKNDQLKVETFKLENGLKVYFNVDNSATNVFGGVLVKAGSIHESPDATGMSHYLEHMLFKGNRNLGTIDFSKEKGHYQRIVSLYDELPHASSSKRKEIQKQINQESVAAAKYGLPNEFSTLMKSLGATGLSAFADYDVTFYHSYFPAHHMSDWLDINSERFVDPVFRTFQSELEVVYEEKNRYDDDFENAIYDAMQEILYPNYTYGLWPTIGKTEHLKNPSLSKMHEFYDRHYVPDNMTLILSGNFDPVETKKLVTEKFSRLEGEPYHPIEFSEYQPIRGEHKKEINVTPYPLGGILFPIAKYGHQDRAALDICQYLLSNEQKTGVLDQLVTEQKILQLYAEYDDHGLASSWNVFFIPQKGQSIEDAKQLIFQQIRLISDRSVADLKLKIAKQNIIKDFWMSLENLEERSLAIASSDYLNMSWEYYISYPDRIEEINKGTVEAAAKKYFSDNYGFLVSEKGKPQKDKIKKPSFEPVLTDQSQSSSYAKNFQTRLSESPSRPLLIDFSKIEKFSMGQHNGVIVKNTANDLFSLEINFQRNVSNDPLALCSADVFEYIATDSLSNSEIRNAFEVLGCQYELKVENEKIVLSLEGFDSQLGKCLELVHTMFSNPKVEQKEVQALVTTYEQRRAEELQNPFTLGYALIRYGVFGQNTKFLNRMTIDDVQNLNPENLKDRLKQLYAESPIYFNYMGNTPKERLTQILGDKLMLAGERHQLSSTSKEIREVKQNQIYFIHADEARQSQVYFYLKGEKYTSAHYALAQAFNTYYGESLTGVVYQEIREYRSLAYSTFARYITLDVLGGFGYLVTGFGCQSDKTNETIDVMADLMSKFPSREGRMEALRSTKTEEINASFPGMRDLGAQVIGLEANGYTQDPNQEAYEVYKGMKMIDLEDFYNAQFGGKPFVLTIYGNRKDIDFDQLNKLGKITELEVKDILVY